MRPRHTFASVVTELSRGLSDGSIVLGGSDWPHKPKSPFVVPSVGWRLPAAVAFSLCVVVSLIVSTSAVEARPEFRPVVRPAEMRVDFQATSAALSKGSLKRRFIAVRRAQGFFEKGNAELSHFDEAQVYYRESSLEVPTAAAHLNRALCFDRLHHQETAIGELNLALALSGGPGQDEVRAAILTDLGNLHALRYEWNEAVSVYARAQELARALKSAELNGWVAVGLGESYLMQGMASKAIPLLEDALNIGQKSVNAEFRDAVVSRALTNLGLAYYYEGNLVKSLFYQNQALEFDRVAGNLLYEAKDRINIGRAMEDQGDLQHARASYEEALRINRQLRNAEGEAAALINIASVLRTESTTSAHPDLNLREAIDQLEKARSINRRTGNIRAEASALGVLGVAELKLGHFSEALGALEQGLELDRRMGNGLEQAKDLANIGTTYLLLDKKADALQKMQQARTLYLATVGTSPPLLDETIGELTSGVLRQP